MRKLLLSGLACVAFVGSSFASNEIINNLTKNGELTSDVKVTSVSEKVLESDNETRPCSWRAAVRLLDGTIVIKEGSTECEVSKEDCRSAADGWAAATMQLTPIVPGSLDVVWGDRL